MAGQLSGRGIAIDCQSPSQPAGGVSADDERRRRTGVPEDIRFKTKPEIEQIRAASTAGLPLGVLLMDAGYGCNTELRSSISALGLTYVAGILPNTMVWAPGMSPLHPKNLVGSRTAAEIDTA
jgi:SRSO17 transposase